MATARQEQVREEFAEIAHMCSELYRAGKVPSFRECMSYYLRRAHA